MKLMIDEEQFATWKQAVSVFGDLGKWERRWAMILYCSLSLMQWFVPRRRWRRPRTSSQGQRVQSCTHMRRSASGGFCAALTHSVSRIRRCPTRSGATLIAEEQLAALLGRREAP